MEHKDFCVLIFKSCCMTRDWPLPDQKQLHSETLLWVNVIIQTSTWYKHSLSLPEKVNVLIREVKPSIFTSQAVWSHENHQSSDGSKQGQQAQQRTDRYIWLSRGGDVSDLVHGRHSCIHLCFVKRSVLTGTRVNLQYSMWMRTQLWGTFYSPRVRCRICCLPPAQTLTFWILQFHWESFLLTLLHHRDVTHTKYSMKKLQ